MNRNSARLFFALWPNGPVRDALVSIQTRLNAPGRAVPAEKLHVTLAFMGDVETGRIPGLEEIAAQFRVPGKPLLLDRLGWFKGSRVGWLGCQSVPGAWAHEVAALSERLGNVGFRTERRPWKPHVTLYRDLRTAPGKISIKAISWTPENLCLVRSDLDDKGSKYTIIGRWS